MVRDQGRIGEMHIVVGVNPNGLICRAFDIPRKQLVRGECHHLRAGEVGVVELRLVGQVMVFNIT